MRVWPNAISQAIFPVKISVTVIPIYAFRPFHNMTPAQMVMQHNKSHRKLVAIGIGEDH